MKSILLLLTLALFVSVGCKNKQSTTATAEEPTAEQKREDEILKAGYAKGVIEDLRNLDGCKFGIKLDESGDYIQPIKLEDRFKVAGTKVWVKYHPVKIMSNCMKGIPVELDEIKVIE